MALLAVMNPSLHCLESRLWLKNFVEESLALSKPIPNEAIIKKKTSLLRCIPAA